MAIDTLRASRYRLLGRDLCCDVASAETRAAHCELLIVIEASIDAQLLYLRRLWMKR